MSLNAQTHIPSHSQFQASTLTHRDNRHKWQKLFFTCGHLGFKDNFKDQKNHYFVIFDRKIFQFESLKKITTQIDKIADQMRVFSNFVLRNAVSNLRYGTSLSSQTVT